ncbi:hypothetical protein [Streptomyces sp. NPDC088196]|uniref:hypothetical protein n=1 Tax=Streptomyces sp. NPDC088196 TaxID=3154868 RepID=UPI0034506315
MKATNLLRAIEKLGGTAKIKVTHHEENYSYPGSKPFDSFELVGTLGGYDIHMRGEECRFFTGRRISQRGYDDPGSDYNPGGYEFNYYIKDLERYARHDV